jgi:hypothetical protein
MKRILMIAGLAFVVSSVALAQSIDSVKDGNAETEREVIQTVQNISEAWAKNDLPTLERLVTDDYIHTDIFGRVQNRSEWLAEVRSHIGSDTAGKMEFEDLKVRIYGDVAVVTGRIIVHFPILKLPLSGTQVLIKKNGYWQRSAFQAGVAELPRYLLLLTVLVAVITLFTTTVLIWIRSKLLHRSKPART